ncbi:MAG: cupin domain-containing protein [Nitrospinota bacterium]|jgi:quercetin dioxygenase-like cupin family protein|nr:cupin domain-containing protein [Nitrospinota bacterium]MDP6366719.1 cupin domain-containing protein [Nitrospinota bacterium]MDP7167274.1 cupin domain-containing protein [Nitrospinota bacterium]MDP7372041.1 cupin domain-containing protein [Nitrospinota bacterium]MDP7503548.1 cupin domain-containing protein [Nitrospinota bacterium]|tara:strand:- start:11 stop:340 length:330 start_codon:yes stop_codon:yes gene_type:complete
MQHFYDLNQVKEQDMPGRKRRLVVGKDVMLVYVEREAGTTQEHTHDNEQLVYLQKGEARFTVDGDSREIEAGGVVHIPAGALHGLEAHTPITYIGIYTPPRKEVIDATA